MSDVIFKIIIVGLGGVGKTSICTRIEGKQWPDQYFATLGMNLFNYNIEIRGKKVQNIIYDTGGQQLFASMNKFYYRGSTAAVVVYDVNNRESFEAIPEWLDTIKKEGGSIPLLGHHN